ncbi:MAG TPA: hypothetical protein VGA56_16375 [Opitutaceae bacterium]
MRQVLRIQMSKLFQVAPLQFLGRLQVFRREVVAEPVIVPVIEGVVVELSASTGLVFGVPPSGGAIVWEYSTD